MRKLIASVALVTAVAVGGLAVAAVNPLQFVSAESSSPSTATADPASTQAGRAARGKLLDRALAGLVDKGTITADQAAAVKAAIRAEVKTFREEHKGGVRKGQRKRLRRGIITTSAKTIGISREDLVKALKSGQSIAQVAQSKGVDVQTVIDAIVKAGTTRVDAALKAGKIDAARAAKIKERLPELAEKAVNRVPGEHKGSGGD